MRLKYGVPGVGDTVSLTMMCTPVVARCGQGLGSLFSELLSHFSEPLRGWLVLAVAAGGAIARRRLMHSVGEVPLSAINEVRPHLFCFAVDEVHRYASGEGILRTQI